MTKWETFLEVYPPEKIPVYAHELVCFLQV